MGTSLSERVSHMGRAPFIISDPFVHTFNMNNPDPARISEEQMKVSAQMEEMVLDTYNRMRRSCTAKCSKPQYNDTDVHKNEAVCIDRCVAKYMELHDIVGRRISRDKDTYELLTSRPYEQEG